MASPYDGLIPSAWAAKTRKLVRSHPLSTDEIVEVVLASWRAIFESKIGPKGFQIGHDITPKPQIMGFFLHELVPLEFARRYPNQWSPERTAGDKDMVCLLDARYSIELKTSSHASQVFGNRSYAQKRESSKKSKSGYYLAVNFESFKKGNKAPVVRKIRFGWLDESDWIGQRSQTGQQARLDPAVERSKLLTLFEA
jgi:hypothetical protein